MAPNDFGILEGGALTERGTLASSLVKRAIIALSPVLLQSRSGVWRRERTQRRRTPGRTRSRPSALKRGGEGRLTGARKGDRIAYAWQR